MTNTTLHQRAADLRDQGRRTSYAIDYATVSNPAQATHLNIRLGEQWSGRRLYVVDLDSHNPGQNADAAKRAFSAERPELAARFPWHRSQSDTGWHAPFESSVQIDCGPLYDAAGNHIGELLGADNAQVHDWGDLQIPILHAGEVERLLNVWHVKGSDPKGEQWKDRAKQGANWTRGYRHVTQIELRAHLKRNCGPRGAAADLLFDQRELFDRSAAFGRLVQTLMLHAHKLPGQQNTGFIDKCRAVMAYAMASNMYGKAGEKGYTPEKDAASLIAQIVNGDPYGEGQHWITPFWAKGNTTATAAPAPTPAPEPTRPAHRPAGDKAKHLVTFRRILEAIEPDGFGRRTYTLEHLAGRMKIAHCEVGTRTIQSYLHELREKREIVTAQIGGNGMPYAVLKPCFGGEFKSEKRVEIAPESPVIRGADQIAEQGTLTPQSVESPPVCKEDHQSFSAPARRPPSAPPAVEDLVARDLAILQALYADLRPLSPEERAKSRKVRQKRFIPRKGQQLDKRYSLTNHGEAPAPAAYRPPAAPLPLENLPEPPAAAAPAGAQGAGVPLLAPAGAAPVGLVERLHVLKAQRQQAQL